MEARMGACRDASARMRPILAALVAASLMMTGCQGRAMDRAEAGTGTPSRTDNTVADWPLKFVQHNFGARCFAASGCRVVYDGFRHLDYPDDEWIPGLDDAHPDALKNAGAGYIAVRNFPEPANVSWRSRDGVRREAKVDIGEIFRDGLILHEVPKDDIPEGVSILNPDIILAIEDRTISVYMRARIPTKSLRTLGNPHSDYRKDLVLAWTRTY